MSKEHPSTASDIASAHDASSTRDVCSARDSSSAHDTCSARDAFSASDVSAASDIASTRDVRSARDSSSARDVCSTRDVCPVRDAFSAYDACSARDASLASAISTDLGVPSEAGASDDAESHKASSKHRNLPARLAEVIAIVAVPVVLVICAVANLEFTVLLSFVVVIAALGLFFVSYEYDEGGSASASHTSHSSHCLLATTEQTSSTSASQMSHSSYTANSSHASGSYHVTGTSRTFDTPHATGLPHTLGTSRASHTSNATGSSHMFGKSRTSHTSHISDTSCSFSAPRLRDIMPTVVLAALAAAGRILFAPFPDFKPVSAIAIIAGVVFGRRSGFMVGALAALVSNFFFGQGAWTPWQMYAWGFVGYLAGLLAQAGVFKGASAHTPVVGQRQEASKQKKTINQRIHSLIAASPLYIYGFLSGLLYGFILNLWSIVGFYHPQDFAQLFMVYAAAFPFDLVHGIATVVFLLVLYLPWRRKLERVKRKYDL